MCAKSSKKKVEEKMSEESVLSTLEFEAPETDALESVAVAEAVAQEDEIQEEAVRPAIYDPEWHDWVMNQFRADEMQEGNPTTDGLRRLAQKLIGEIVDSVTDVVEGASDVNGRRATVTVAITFQDTEGRTRRFSGAADSSPDNTDEVYRKYPTAIAESRAEGRALRKALNLRKVVSADELSIIASSDVSGSEFMKIDKAQIKGIDVMCKRLDADVKKFINMGSKQYASIKEVEYETAVKMMQELNRYQLDEKNPEGKKMPDSVKGYVEGWNKE